MEGIYILRNDLCVLEYESTEAGCYCGFVSTVYRSLAKRFNTYAEAEEVIRHHQLKNCIVIEFVP